LLLHATPLMVTGKLT